jgi:hypothetical protein
MKFKLYFKYIHGQQDNPIYYIAKDNKQIDDVYNEILSDDDSGTEDNSGIPIDLNIDGSELFITEEGQKLDSKFVNDIYKITSKVIKMEANPNEDISVAHLMLNRFNKEIKKIYNSQDYAQAKPLIDGVFIWR